MNFRGLVYSKYRTIADMARELKWTRQKATNIVNGKQEPSVDDVCDMATALGLSFEDVSKFFLRRKSQKCDE